MNCKSRNPYEGCGFLLKSSLVISRLVRGIHLRTGVDKRYWVYMMSSGFYGTLYIGVTSDLPARVWQHKNNVVEGFTEKYEVHHLIWFEEYSSVEEAIKREKRLKKYNRDWKINLINEKIRIGKICMQAYVCRVQIRRSGKSIL